MINEYINNQIELMVEKVVPEKLAPLMILGDYWVIPEAELTLIKRKERGRPPMKN